MHTTSTTLSFSLINGSMGTWGPTTYPTTSPNLTTVTPTLASSLMSVLSSASSVAHTETDVTSLYYISQDIRGALASLTVISLQKYFATATATQELPLATQALYNVTLNLIDLNTPPNYFGFNPNLIPNILFTALYGIALIIHSVIAAFTNQYYFSLCVFLGTATEFAGYVARVVAHDNYGDLNAFLCQIVCLTLAPAFLMAGVYFLLAELIVIHGRQTSVLKPLWFSYVFVVCDAVSLIVQAAGGGIASMALKNHQNLDPGTHVMVGGIATQVFCMSIFMYFLFDFYYRAFFKMTGTVRFGCKNFLSILFVTKRGRQLRKELEPYYNPEYRGTRKRPYFEYLPLVLLAAVILVYIRCVYRVVELAEGWNGSLITREAFPMSMDAALVFIATVLFMFFHPGLIFGSNCELSFSNLKSNNSSFSEFDADEKMGQFDNFHYSLR